MKNETANPPTPLPPSQSWMTPRKRQNAPFSHPCLEGRMYIISHLFRTNIEDNLPKDLILITQDFAMKFLPQAAQLPRTLLKPKPR